MGLTCANIHIFTGGQRGRPHEPELGRVLDEACDQIGYEGIESGDPTESDLVAVAASSWVSVLAPRNPGIITEHLAKLAGRLSGASGCPVLLASVYDSDEFAFLVFEGEKQVDSYTTQDDLLPLPFKAWSAKKRTGQWSRLFDQSLEPRDIQELTQPPGLFADDRLAALCRLVGIPIEHGALNPSDFDPPRALSPRCYRFRSAAGPVEGDASVAQFIPPNLEAQYRAGETPKPMPLVPEEETGYYVVLTGPAGAFSDPVLEFYGPAVTRGLVEVFYAHGEWYCGEENILAGRAPWLEAQLEEAPSHEGESIVRARLHGLSAGQFEFPPEPQTKLTISLRLKAVEAGVGELRARFLPNPQATESVALSPVFRVEITLPKWAPLQCESHIRSCVRHPQLLAHAQRTSREGIRLLNTPAVLSGVAILADREQQRFAPIPGLLERWLNSLELKTACHVQTAYEGQMNPRTFHIPRKRQSLRPEESGLGKKWQRLFAKPGAIQSLFLQVVQDESETARAGASVQRTFEDDDGDVAGTIHLAFWRRCLSDGGADEADRDTQQHLTILIDSAFETMDGLQGWVARWDWIPRFSMGEENNYTPYEVAYAIDSPSAERDDDSGGYMDEKWCSRYLRGLSERLWLGGSLLERIDRERLAAVATVTDVGLSSVRTDLLANIQLNRLEELLSPILPISKTSP